MEASRAVDLEGLFPDATPVRLEQVRAALEEMAADAEVLGGLRLGYLEPLVLPGQADRWIEQGGRRDR